MTPRAHIQYFEGTENNPKSNLLKNVYSPDSMEIPDALVSYCNRILYGVYITLEKQLNETLDPEIYDKLDTITQSVFDSWISLRYREGGDSVDASN